VCFLGPSGCGKTTLLRAIAGLDIQSSGRILQGGKDISSLPPSERDFGIVFQSYALFPNLSVERNVAYGLQNVGRGRATIRERVRELLELVGLADQGPKYPAQLSGGEQQRVALARALATSPGLLLLDEPLSALDAKVRVHLRHEIKSLQERLGVTTIMVTHDQEEALSMADRIVVMNHGAIEQVGTPIEIYREPASLFVADFIGEMNALRAVVEDSRRLRTDRGSLERAGGELGPGQAVAVIIRPEDIVLAAAGVGLDTANSFDATVLEREFLGPFWRVQIACPGLGDAPLVANVAVNAAREMGLEEGMPVRVALPAERLHVFAAGRS
jgi:iron(III) transport system ATP-binding protein